MALLETRCGGSMESPHDGRPVPPVHHGSCFEITPRVRRPLYQHAAVAGNLEAKKRRCDVECDELDMTTGRTRDLHFQRASRIGIDSKYTDVEVACRSQRVSRRGAEKHRQT